MNVDSECLRITLQPTVGSGYRVVKEGGERNCGELGVNARRASKEPKRRQQRGWNLAALGRQYRSSQRSLTCTVYRLHANTASDSHITTIQITKGLIRSPEYWEDPFHLDHQTPKSLDALCTLTMAEQSINIPQVVVFAVVAFLVYRWYSSKPSASGTRPAANRSARVNPAQIDTIAQMFPQLNRRDIAWDLQRNGGNAAATTERVLSGRSLDSVSPDLLDPQLVY